METKNLSKSLKDQANNNSNFDNTDSISSSNNNEQKYPWSSCSNTSYGENYLRGFSWPPRSYSCSFCKREFGSAQALGRHMNVHRRDRARLRHSPPTDTSPSHILNLNINPNPNPDSVVSALCSPTHSCTKTTSFGTRNFKTRKSFFDSHEEFEDDGRKLMKKAEILKLDLEIGLSSHSNEDLNLALRLGYS